MVNFIADSQAADERTPLLAAVARAQGDAPLPRALRAAHSPDAPSGRPTRKESGSLSHASKLLMRLSTSQDTSRAYWYKMLRPHSHAFRSRMFRTCITSVILIDVLAFVLQSDAQISRGYTHSFAALEGISSVVFLAEYLLRIWTIPERRRYTNWSDWRARATWMITWESIIDLLATLPWFFEQAAVGLCLLVHKGCEIELPNFSFLRILRLFRLLKAQPVVGAFDVVARVIYYNAEILLVALLICCVMILVTATILFYLRPDNPEDDFSSIMATTYLSVMMLTGQGQPGGTLPWYTKLIVVVTAIFSVAQFAIPASMLTWGFEAEAERRMRKQFEQRKKQAARLSAGQDDASSSSSEEGSNSEWEEYEEVVVGSEGSDASSSDKSRSEQSLCEQATQRDPSEAMDAELKRLERFHRRLPGEHRPPKRSSRKTTKISLTLAEAVPSRVMSPDTPQLLVQIAGQLETLNNELARLKQRNEELEAENARLKGANTEV